MEFILKDQKQMINYLHKQAEDHVKTRKMLTQINEDLEKEMDDKIEENRIIKKELELNCEENLNLKKSFEIFEEIIEKLRLKDIEYCGKVKELEDEREYSDRINKIDKENLEKDLFDKSEEVFY